MIRAIDYLKIVVCFLLGSAVAALPSLLFGPGYWLFVFMYGMYFGLPALILVLVLYSVFIKKILARPNLWCFGTPFVLTACIVFFLQYEFTHGGDNFTRTFLADDYFLTLAAIMVFIGAVVATVLFRRWVLFPKKYAAERALQNG